MNCNKPKIKGFIDEKIVEKALFFCGQGKYHSHTLGWFANGRRKENKNAYIYLRNQLG